MSETAEQYILRRGLLREFAEWEAYQRKIAEAWRALEHVDEDREESRVIVWYSDGEASAVAAKLAVEKYGDRCEIVKCDTTSSEHPDAARLRRDVEAWIGRRVTLIRSEKYANVDEVFEQTRYMAGIGGARCTTELKKLPRYAFQREGDVHIFGYTVEEAKRAKMFELNNPELTCEWILIDKFIRKSDCRRMIAEAGIKAQEMYVLGFEHANCLGCPKATSPGYWNRTRKHFPDVFERRARQSREIGARLVRYQGKRIFLDELPQGVGVSEPDGDMECGPFCQMPAEEAVAPPPSLLDVLLHEAQEETK